MATNTAKLLHQSQLPALAGIAVKYTSPAVTKTIVTEINLCNTGAGANAVTLRAVSGGGVGTAANDIFNSTGFSLAAGETVIRAGSLVLEAADTISGGATNANEVTITISGVQVT